MGLCFTNTLYKRSIFKDSNILSALTMDVQWKVCCLYLVEKNEAQCNSALLTRIGRCDGGGNPYVCVRGLWCSRFGSMIVRWWNEWTYVCVCVCVCVKGGRTVWSPAGTINGGRRESPSLSVRP